jgi:hypothetical protein
VDAVRWYCRSENEEKSPFPTHCQSLTDIITTISTRNPLRASLSMSAKIFGESILMLFQLTLWGDFIKRGAEENLRIRATVLSRATQNRNRPRMVRELMASATRLEGSHGILWWVPLVVDILGDHCFWKALVSFSQFGNAGITSGFYFGGLT